jgi:hypothetical protein
METQTETEQEKALKELGELCTQIRQFMSAGNVNCHAIGRVYNYAVSKKLAETAKQKNAQVYFSKNIKDLSRATLVMYGAVAREFEASVCAQHGMTALSLLLTYAEASKTVLDHNDPSTTLIDVPDATGEVEQKFFGECSVAELRKALLRLRKPTSSAPLPSEIMARVQQCTAIMTAFFPEKAGVEMLVHNRKGKAAISLKEIPLEQFEQLSALVSAHLRPAEAQPELRS